MGSDCNENPYLPFDIISPCCGGFPFETISGPGPQRSIKSVYPSEALAKEGGNILMRFAENSRKIKGISVDNAP